jgi:hypothetical protein
MQPLFNVGEEVKLVSISFPEYNGDYKVLQIIPDGETYIDPYTRQNCRALSGNSYGYILDEYLPFAEGDTIRFCQSALRKKYPPSDFTFDELIANICSSDMIST